MSLFWINDKPTTKPEDWKWSLQEPEKQWRPGYSAWAVAHSWEAAQGFPPEIEDLLNQHFTHAELIKGLVEYQIPMPGVGYPSHNDLFVQATSAQGDLCIAVEGKVTETLGPTIATWNNGTPNRQTRLSGILGSIGLPPIIPDSIRYQLLHRLASPVVAAKHIFNARFAVMIIHSFSDSDKSFTDFAALLSLYGISDAKVGKLYALTTVENIKLYAGWARGDQRYLFGES